MKSYRKFAARAALLSCVSVAALGAAVQPSHAEQQVFQFFVNGPSGSGFTGGLSHYSGPGYAHSQTPPEAGAFRTTSSGYGAISEASSIGHGTQGGAVVSTLNDAFDGYGGINGGTLGDGTGAPSANVANFGGLTVVRDTQVTLGPQGTTALTALANAAGIPNLARWVDTFTNNTGAPITVTIAYENNLGSDSNTKYFTVGANNTFLTSQQYNDSCGVSKCATDPTVTAVLGNNAYTKNMANLYVGDGADNPEYAYSITLAPGQSTILATFAILTGDVNRGDGVDANSNGIEDAIESDIALGQTLAEIILNDPEALLGDLTALQRSEILNFDLCGTIDTSQPSYDQGSCEATAVPMVFDGGTLKPTAAATFNQAVTLDAAGGTIDDSNGTVTMNGAISGPGGLTVTGGGLTILNGDNSYAGPTDLVSGMLELNGMNTGSDFTVTSGQLIIGATGSISDHTITVNGGSLYSAGNISNSTVTFGAGTSGFIDATGTFSNNSVINFSGTNLGVDGSLVNAMLTMNSGFLYGTGTLGTTLVKSGATIAPGDTTPAVATLHVTGDLTLAPGSRYLVNISGTTTDKLAVTGQANLGGEVDVFAAPGSYSVGESFTILTAGSRTGTFTTLTTAGFSHALLPTLTYSGTSVVLVLDPNQLTPTLPSDASINEQRVAAAVDFAVAHDNALGFGPLFDQHGSSLEVALDQLAGEGDTQAARGSFEMGSTFLSVMLDPTIDSRGGMAGASGPSLAYAPISDGQQHVALTGARQLNRLQLGQRVEDAAPRAAAASPLSASAAGATLGLWFSGYGQRDSADGSWPLGTHQETSSQAGFAAGIDWRMSHDTVLGLAGGYGHMSWAVSSVNGSGKANVTQGGVYGATRLGDAYLSAAFAYSNYDVTTFRTLILSGTNRYTASYSAHGYGGRAEVGEQLWHAGWTDISPYVAVLVQNYDAPSYGETTLAGNPLFAHTVAAQSQTDVASELGLKTDTIADRAGGLSVHTTVAWAHDYTPRLSNVVGFSSLVGTGFTVHGAPMMQDAALVELGLDETYDSGLSLGLKVSSKFGEHAMSYGGMGSVGYHW